MECSSSASEGHPRAPVVTQQQLWQQEMWIMECSSSASDGSCSVACANSATTTTATGDVEHGASWSAALALLRVILRRLW